MGVLDDDKYRYALRLVVQTKREMDSLQAQLDQAEDAYWQACRELDALEDKQSVDISDFQ